MNCGLIVKLFVHVISHKLDERTHLHIPVNGVTMSLIFSFPVLTYLISYFYCLFVS